MTGTPGPDEKVCPFCAEVIKAAAVKCRYCHSDLPEDPGAEPTYTSSVPPAEVVADAPVDLPVAPDLLPPDPVVPPPPSQVTDGESGSVLTRATVLMLVACLLLAAGIAGLVLSARPDGLRTASNGQVTSTSYRSAAMSAAAANATAVLSYGYKTLDADQKAAREVLTPGFAKKYAKVMEKAGPKATEAKLTLKATVMSTSLVSLKKGTAKALLFVNTITTAEGSEKQQLNQNRVIVTMKRQDGDWVVSNLDAF